MQIQQLHQQKLHRRKTCRKTKASGWTNGYIFAGLPKPDQLLKH